MSEVDRTVIERWTLRPAPFSRPDGVEYTLIVADGPELKGSERPEVVRADQLAGAVKALEAIEARCVRILVGGHGGLDAADEIRVVAAHALRDARGQ